MLKLQNVSLILALIGIIALILLSNCIEPKTRSISEIDKSKLGEYVKISGEISNIRQSSVTSFTIKDESSEIYGFSYEPLDLKNGEYEIIGKVNEYKDSLEIEVNKLRRIR